MKKFILAALTVAVLTTLGAPASWSDTFKDDIIFKKNNNTTRSISVMPEASIRHEVLSVSFDGSGIYSLYIEDSFGAVAYQSMLPADGMEYDYDLSGIGEGLFRLILDGHDGEYEGFFILR